MLGEVTRYPRYWWRRWRQPLVVTVHGTQLELGPHLTPELRDAVYKGRYERSEARCLNCLLKASDTVMEIGAGIGFLSTLAALRIGSDRVHAYEANPAMIPVIERTYALNGVQPTLTNATLGESDGVVEFFVEENLTESSLFRRSDSAKAVSVPRLDINREIERIRPTVLVIDIEGAECELVPLIRWQAIEKVLIDLHPFVIGEEKVKDVVAEIVAAGFTVDRRRSGTIKKLLVRSHDSGAFPPPLRHNGAAF